MNEETTLEELINTMSSDGSLIFTREADLFVVYWARQPEGKKRQTSIAKLKSSVEGRGDTALDALRQCALNAEKPDEPSVKVVTTTTTTIRKKNGRSD